MLRIQPNTYNVFYETTALCTQCLRARAVSPPIPIITRPSGKTSNWQYRANGTPFAGRSVILHPAWSFLEHTHVITSPQACVLRSSSPAARQPAVGNAAVLGYRQTCRGGVTRKPGQARAEISGSPSVIVAATYHSSDTNRAARSRSHTHRHKYAHLTHLPSPPPPQNIRFC